MKQVIYEIRGVITEEMIPAITASCESLAGVEATALVTDGESSRLTVTCADTPDAATEEALRGIFATKDLTLMLPALSSESIEPPKAEKPAREVKHYVTTPPPKKQKQVGLTSAVAAVITAVILAVTLTFSVCTLFMDRTPVYEAPETEGINFNAIDRLFRSATMLDEIDDEALINAVLKSYVAATGDVYAEYFTAEEWAQMTEEKTGKMTGIGVSVVEGRITVNGIDHTVITVMNVHPDTPAARAGILPGDHIMYVGEGEDKILVNDLGYTKSLDRLRGEIGTVCAFTIYRESGDSYESIDMAVTRETFTTYSVTGRVHQDDPTVGIVKITGFDDTTALQLTAAVDSLIEQGCTCFVFDLRNNPGGYVSSVEDVLTYFLNAGDVIMTTENSIGQKSVSTVTVSGDKVTSGSGRLKASDVGKYRNLKKAVLVNGYSASAAELFTSNFRDYELGTIVGENTYGKGSGQTTMSLKNYGFSGYLKMTTFFYYPPCGEGYNGIGISPDIEVELSEEAKEYNIHLLPDAKDNQLAAAVEAFKSAQ